MTPQETELAEALENYLLASKRLQEAIEITRHRADDSGRTAVEKKRNEAASELVGQLSVFVDGRIADYLERQEAKTRNPY